jgi:hypothetical protein
MKPQLAILSMIFTAILVLLIATPFAQAQKLVGTNRPAAVPEGYVVTPFGYFHPSCVREVGSGDTVLADGRVQHADGGVDAAVSACAYPRYSARGEVVAAGPNPPSIGHSWIESGNAVNTTSAFSELTTNWTVPPAPTSSDGQTIYMFPGMEDFDNVELIIQPVLGWDADFENAWGIASWNCCAKGVTWESAPEPVHSGDVILGTIKSTCPAGTKSCAKWNIITEDQTTGKSTTLSKTPSEGQTFTWAQGGVLEVYGIAKCGDYPPNKSTTFSNLALYDINFNKIPSPGWFLFNFYTGLQPQCTYGGRMSTTAVQINY